MKKAKDLYETEEDGYFSVYNYQPIINELGSVLLQVDDEDYQGDSRVLYEKNGRYGFLIFGWGSCSGCDALQACENVEEVQELMDGMSGAIKWFDSLDELQSYFSSKDWDLEWSYNAEETKKFVEKVISFKINSKGSTL